MAGTPSVFPSQVPAIEPAAAWAGLACTQVVKVLMGSDVPLPAAKKPAGCGIKGRRTAATFNTVSLITTSDFQVLLHGPGSSMKCPDKQCSLAPDCEDLMKGSEPAIVRKKRKFRWRSRGE